MQVLVKIEYNGQVWYEVKSTMGSTHGKQSEGMPSNNRSSARSITRFEDQRNITQVEAAVHNSS